MIIKQFKFKLVGSTNNVAINLIKHKKLKVGAILAERQNKGRGQRGKKWISYKGNFFASFFYSLEKINLSLQQLTLINAKLTKKIISRYYRNNVKIKLPNDILINEKKICGILQETIEKNNIKYLIVGIGVNLIRSPKISSYPTTNLYELTEKKICINKVIKDLKYIYRVFLKSQRVH